MEMMGEDSPRVGNSCEQLARVCNVYVYKRVKMRTGNNFFQFNGAIVYILIVFE